MMKIYWFALILCLIGVLPNTAKTQTYDSEMRNFIAPEEQLKQQDIEILTSAYSSYLQLKQLYAIPPSSGDHYLVSNTDMEAAKISMKSIDRMFQFLHPNFDTESIWNRVALAYHTDPEKLREFSLNNPTPPEDLLELKSLEVNKIELALEYFTFKVEGSNNVEKDF